MNIRHVGIVVDNLSEMVSFYRNWFGAEVQREMDEQGDFISFIMAQDNINIKTVKMSFPLGQSQLELIKLNNLESVNASRTLISSGLTHIAFTVNDLDSLSHKMKKSSVKFLSDPKISEDGKAKVCFCQDPEGNHIEMVELVSNL